MTENVQNNQVEGLTEDEVYAKLQTEKLVKSKNKRKIATIIGLVFAFALAVVIIVLAVVPVSLKPKCISADFNSVQFYENGSIKGAILKAQPEQKNEYDMFVKTFNSSFAQPYISAIFSGALSDYTVDEEINKDFSSAKNDLMSSKCILISYENPKILTNQNGSQYVTVYNISKEPLTFDKMYIVVNEEEGFKDTKIYLNVDYTSTKEKDNALVVITLRANTYKIFEKWSSFIGG